MNSQSEYTNITSSDPLLQPLQIKHLRLRNRIMSTSHACGLEENGMPTQAYQRYHEEKARGGIALTMFGGSSNVDRDSPNIFQQLNVGTDAIIPHLQRFSETMHRYDTALMCQLTHLGRRGNPYVGDWLPSIAPSPLRETLHRAIPREMDEHDIARVVKAYADAARRCKEGGLDGIETLAAGHLIGQFLSPRTNRRTDRFGGSLENRCRFALMVHEAIREAVGDDFLIGIRFTVDEALDGGQNFDESLQAALILRDAGVVDFFNANYGTMDTVKAMAREVLPGMGTPIAPWVSAVGAFRAEVGLPVFHSCKIADVASARFAISEGMLDMAGMTRAQIADPHLVAKLQAGREEDIRPCVGATHCQSPYRPTCLHNPATGRELTLEHVITPGTGIARKVVVVGAGPAGLEAARVSAERGHVVEVYEATEQPGGQVRIGAQNWRRDLIGVVDWRVQELERLGVTIRTNHYMDDSDILALNPDVVVLATGGVPQIDVVSGEDLCHSTWDVLSGQVPVARRVLVYDGTGRHPGPLAAQRCKESGADVVYVSIDQVIGEELTYAERYEWKRIFLELEVSPIAESRLMKVERHNGALKATVLNEITGNESSFEVDQVIIEQGTIPFNDLFESLRPHSSNDGVTDIEALVAVQAQPRARDAGFELHRVGDAVASRNIHTAVLDSLRLCSAL